MLRSSWKGKSQEHRAKSSPSDFFAHGVFLALTLAHCRTEVLSAEQRVLSVSGSSTQSSALVTQHCYLINLFARISVRCGIIRPSCFMESCSPFLWRLRLRDDHRRFR